MTTTTIRTTEEVENTKDAIVQWLMASQAQLSAELATMTGICERKENTTDGSDREPSDLPNGKILMHIQSLLLLVAELDSEQNAKTTDTLQSIALRLQSLISTLVQTSSDTDKSDKKKEMEILEEAEILEAPVVEEDNEKDILLLRERLNGSRRKKQRKSSQRESIERNQDVQKPRRTMWFSRGTSNLFFRRRNSKKRRSTLNSELSKSRRMSSDLKSLADTLAEEVADKEDQIKHLNQVKRVLGNRVRELEEIYGLDEMSLVVLERTVETSVDLGLP